MIVDTSFFRGNYPEHFSLEACDLGGHAPFKNEAKRLKDAAAQWTEIVPQTALKGDSQKNLVAIASRLCHASSAEDLSRRWRCPLPRPRRSNARRKANHQAQNRSRCGRQRWQRRNVERSVLWRAAQFADAVQSEKHGRRLGNQTAAWAWARLGDPETGVPGSIRRIEVNTAHFKGNFPDSCSLEACHAAASSADAFLAAPQCVARAVTASETKSESRAFVQEVERHGACDPCAFQHLSGRRCEPFAAVRASRSGQGPFRRDETVQSLPRTKARQALLDRCGSQMWVEQMLQRMPFPRPA